MGRSRSSGRAGMGRRAGPPGAGSAAACRDRSPRGLSRPLSGSRGTDGTAPAGFERGGRPARNAGAPGPGWPVRTPRSASGGRSTGAGAASRAGSRDGARPPRADPDHAPRPGFGSTSSSSGVVSPTGASSTGEGSRAGTVRPPVASPALGSGAQGGGAVQSPRRGRWDVAGRSDGAADRLTPSPGRSTVRGVDPVSRRVRAGSSFGGAASRRAQSMNVGQLGNDNERQ